MRTPFVLRSRFLIILAAPLIALRVTFDIYMGNYCLRRVVHTLPIVYALKLAWCWGAACGLGKMKKAKAK